TTDPADRSRHAAGGAGPSRVRSTFRVSKGRRRRPWADKRRSQAVSPMTDADAQLERIRAQFGKQADVYARMRQTTDERSLNALVQVSGADAGSRRLRIAGGARSRTHGL